jgi:hypothetical protein
MEMTCKILEPVEGLDGVVQVRVPGIYPKGESLPDRMAKLVRKAAASLGDVYEQVVKEGGHLYLSDCFRSAEDQHRAHVDYISGRKSSYSPDTCSSVHEAARAIDIDAFDTKIGHAGYGRSSEPTGGRASRTRSRTPNAGITSFEGSGGKRIATLTVRLRWRMR